MNLEDQDAKPENPPWRLVVRPVAGGVVVVGILLLVRLLMSVLDGSIAAHGPGRVEPFWARAALGFVLRLPVPLHVISVGLILQSKWLSPAMARTAWVAVVVSGCWVGGALAVRLFLLEVW